MLGNPKMLLILIVGIVVLGVALYGGALGAEFGGGYLGAPLAAIQIPAESITADAIIGDFHITNTMIATWAAIVILALVSLIVRFRITEVPGRLQGLFEVILEFFMDLTESIAGPERGRKFFPLVMTIFLFIVVSNWLGILPGFGTIGRIETVDELVHHREVALDEGEHLDLTKLNVVVFEGDGNLGILGFGSVGDVKTVEEIEEHPLEAGKQAGILVPFLRGANTDINTTLAIALIAMLLVQFWGFTALGVFGHLGKFLNFKEGPIGLFVGLLEIISEIAKIISFTFRLFGNIFAGEVLLVAMMFLIPLVGIIPFLGLELFVGVIQAFIFSMLTLVFATAATTPHHGNSH